MVVLFRGMTELAVAVKIEIGRYLDEKENKSQLSINKRSTEAVNDNLSNTTSLFLFCFVLISSRGEENKTENAHKYIQNRKCTYIHMLCKIGQANINTLMSAI